MYHVTQHRSLPNQNPYHPPDSPDNLCYACYGKPTQARDYETEPGDTPARRG